MSSSGYEGYDSGDVFGRLFERRVVMATGPLDSTLVDKVAAQLLSLDAAGPDPVELVVDCPAAELDPAFALFDVCEALRVPLSITVSGRLVGAGLVLLTGSCRRLGRPHATIQLAEPQLHEVNANAATVARVVEEHRRRVGVLIDRVSERTTRPAPLVADEMARGIFLTSEGAVAYGLLDEVARKASS